jgi:hypothetical protein
MAHQQHTQRVLQTQYLLWKSNVSQQIRTNLFPLDVKEVTKKMLYHDPLIEEDPYFGGIIRKRAEEAEARGLAEGLTALKNALLRTIKARFPDLATISKAVLPDNSEALEALMVDVAMAPDEETVRHLLGIPAH